MSRLALASAAGPLCIFIITASALAIAVETGDGLRVAFSDADGSVMAISVNGIPVSLVPGDPGGLSVCVGNPVAPYAVQHLDFDSGAGPIVSARNANWEDYGSFVTWLADGGIGDTGHLLLGDGVAEGAGMAMETAIAVAPGSKLKISWQSRSASTETTHILCVRIYDALGQDITSSANEPPGWGYSSASLAHYVHNFTCSQPDTWEYFERFYSASQDAAYVRVSLRHWTGGDHLLHIDDFNLDVAGGIVLDTRTFVTGPVSPVTGGFAQSIDVPGQDLHIDQTVTAEDGRLVVDIALQDTSDPLTDRAIQLFWTLPIAAEGQWWWDDIDTWRQIASSTLYRNTFDHNRHPVSFYPFSSVTGADFGLSLAVPQDIPTPQRFEYDTAIGLSSVWEIGLSPVTTKIGLGQATASLVVLHHDPAWGFRAAADRYYELFPEYFVKRTTREGAWMWPIHPSQITDPMDFGFAFLETHPMSQSELDLCDQLGIGVFYYTTPWDAWQGWGPVTEKPSYEERVARLESWAANPSLLVGWVADGGIGNTGHLRLGDGESTGVGMATEAPFDVQPGQTVNISWQAKVTDIATTQILCVRVYDAQGTDITATTPSPSGWFYSSASLAHCVAGLANSVVDTWQSFSRSYNVSAAATQIRVSLRHWNGGDHWLWIDDLRVEDTGGQTTWLALDFDVDGGPWFSAQNSDWENTGPLWLRAPRMEVAQAVIQSSPLDAEGRYFIDAHSYLWNNFWSDNWSQAWPVNPDPDLPSPNSFELHASDKWIYNTLDHNAGVYLDSVTTSSISCWENRRADHLAVADWPLTFSWDDGGAAQIAPAADAELLNVVAADLRSLGKVMMLNIFPQAMRFHSHNADVLGSEIFPLIESNTDSRIRRTLARHRIVSNLLQWGWSEPEYATYEQMEQFIRGQLFWGFYPAVSTAGGMESGDPLNRYFSHPEVYNLHRPLFLFYIPVIRTLSTAGWEPVTGATATPTGELERFGDFARGDVLLTVRGADQAALEALVAVDLMEAGMDSPCVSAGVWDVLADLPVPAQRLDNPPRMCFFVSLAAEQVGVYRLRPFGTGDFDLDDDVDPIDLWHFQDCQTQAGVPQEDPDCQDADLDRDGDVDQSDFGIFQRCLSGYNVSPEPGCSG